MSSMNDDDMNIDTKNNSRIQTFNLNNNLKNTNNINNKFSKLLKNAGDQKIKTNQNYELVIDKIKHLEDKLKYLNNQIKDKKSENLNLKNELLQLEKDNNLIDNKEIDSLLLKKDELRDTINIISKEIIEQNKEIRNNKSMHSVLLEENNNLTKELEDLEKNEKFYDDKINKYNKNLEEYERLKLCLEEKDFIKSEQIFYTKMKLEDNAKIQMDFEVNRIKKEVENNDEMAIYYLEKYIEMLKNKN